MTAPGTYSAGTAFLDVIPSFRGVQEAIKKQVRQIESALGSKAGEEFGKAFEDEAVRSIDKALGTSKAKSAKAGKEAGDQYGGNFADSLRTSMARAQKELDRLKIKPTVDDGKALAQLKKLQAEVKKIMDAKIGVDLDAGDAMIQAAAIASALRALQDASIDVDIRSNLGKATAEIEAWMAKIQKDADFVIEPEIKFERQLGLFERAVRKRIEAALQNFPPVEFDADITPAEEELQRLRAQLIELGDKKIGIDISGADAIAEMERLRLAMAAIANDESVDIKVRADAAGAAAELLAIRKVADLVDDTDVEIEVKLEENGVRAKLAALRNAMLSSGSGGQEGANAFRAFNGVILAATTILPAVIPMIGALAGGLALLGPLAVGAAGGLAVGIMAFSGIGDAVKALNEVENNRTKDAEANAKKMRAASESVADAQRGVERAETSGARSIASANQAVSDARANAADVARDSARRVADAIENQKDAEEDLVRAQRDVVRAQEDVTRARKEAEEQVEDLALSIRGGALAERQAIFDLEDAQKAYDKAKDDPAKTARDRELLLLSLEKEQLNLDRVRESNQDMAQERDEFNRTGIEGSRGVVSAQEGVARANEGVASAQERVQDAVVAVADAVADGQRAQSEASRAIADAVAAQSQAQADAAASVSDAQRNLTKAQADYATALYETGVQGSAAMQALDEAMGALGPPASGSPSSCRASAARCGRCATSPRPASCPASKTRSTTS